MHRSQCLLSLRLGLRGHSVPSTSVMAEFLQKVCIALVSRKENKKENKIENMRKNDPLARVIIHFSASENIGFGWKCQFKPLSFWSSSHPRLPHGLPLMGSDTYVRVI